MEGCATEDGFKIIEDTCKLANAISELTKEKTYVINHLELNLDQLKLFGLYDIIVEKLKYLLKTYPNIIMCLENETAFELFGDKFELKNNYSFETVETCDELRRDLDTDRVGVVLDTCHAISSIRLLQHLVNEGLRKPLELKEYFIQYSKCLYIIHLSNAREYGGNENHGIGFYTKEELKLLETMLGYIEEINFNGILTLEVQEKNYLDIKEFTRLIKQIQDIQNKRVKNKTLFIFIKSN